MKKKKDSKYTDEQLAAFLESENADFGINSFCNEDTLCTCDLHPSFSLKECICSFDRPNPKQKKDVEINDVDTLEALNVSRKALKLFDD